MTRSLPLTGAPLRVLPFPQRPNATLLAATTIATSTVHLLLPGVIGADKRACWSLGTSREAPTAPAGAPADGGGPPLPQPSWRAARTERARTERAAREQADVDEEER